MEQRDFLHTVQPTGGWTAVVGINPRTGRVRQTFADTTDRALELVSEYAAQHLDVYFGVAKYKTPDNRKKPNVEALQALWVDLDCGPDKAAIQEATGRPGGYATQGEAIQALRVFCRTSGLPKPILINSGRGVHAYWPLTESVTPDVWEPLVARLRDICWTQGLHVDSAVFESARIMRVPGTFNYKVDPPLPAEVVFSAAPIALEQLRSILGVVAEPAPVGLFGTPKREMTALGKALAASRDTEFRKIMVRSAAGTGCQQLLDCYTNRATLPEPQWFSALSIAKFCSDRDTAIHKLSSGHPDYDPAATEEKIAHILGPHTCDEIAKHNPAGCNGCPHKGKIKSPIVLGRVVVEAPDPAEDQSHADELELADSNTVSARIPPYPEPFFRGKGGGIYLRPAGEEEEPTLVYENDLYVVKRMEDPVFGDVCIFKLHTPQDGVREFTATNVQLAEESETRKLLARYGVVIGKKRFAALLEYIYLSIRELQHQEKAEKMRLQFGWADNDSKFIIGDREITALGTYHSPPSITTADIAALMQPTGSLEAWKEVWALYGRPGMEPHAFAALTAFGSPLLKFLGQSGAIINVIHPSSGTGKTTILRMCNSVFGHPRELCANWNDTANAKLMRLGIMNNITLTMDEMTNTSPQEFSTLAYSMSQGRGKDRMQASANQLRHNATRWQCISLCSSNASFYEKMASIKATPDGEVMRLIEYNVGYTDTAVIDPKLAKQMFDHQLEANYGHAGDRYIEWLVSNLSEAKETALRTQTKIDRELHLTQRERFWSAILAANITGGLIAKQIGLIDWNLKAIYSWATSMIQDLRNNTQSTLDSPVAVLGGFVNENMAHILVVPDGADRRTKMALLPIMEPRGELLIRYEPDTKLLFCVAKAFRDYCVKQQIAYRDTLNKLQDLEVYKGTKTKCMSKGMDISSPPVHTLMFDATELQIQFPEEVANSANRAGGVQS